MELIVTIYHKILKHEANVSIGVCYVYRGNLSMFRIIAICGSSRIDTYIDIVLKAILQLKRRIKFNLK